MGGLEKELEKDVALVAEKTGMATWMVIGLIVVVVLSVVGTIGWCAWRFLKKKRAGKEEEGALGKVRWFG